MQPSDLFRDIGKIVQVDCNDSKVIGYIFRLEIEKTYLSSYDPRIEAQKNWLGRNLEAFVKISHKNVHAVEEICPVELNQENIASLKIGTPIIYRLKYSVGVGYVAGISSEKIRENSYDPTVEFKKSRWDRISWGKNLNLTDLILPAKVQIPQADTASQ